MSSRYFSRVRGAIRVGFQRLISGKESGIEDQVGVLVGLEKLPFGPARFFHSLPSGIFTLQPNTIAAAQGNLQPANLGKNLSVVGGYSHANFISSVPGLLFQFCGYHADFRPSEPSYCFGSDYSQKAPMAVCGTRSAIGDCSISNLTPKPAQLGVAGFRSCTSYSRRLDSCRNARTSFGNKEHPSNFLLYGYFIYNVAKTKGNDNLFLGFGFERLHISSIESSSASIAPNISFHSSTTSQKPASSSTDSSDLKTPINRTLKLNSGSCYLPHPDKEETGGEDAHFICTDEPAIGVADGVGGWADLGVDSGKYARELMSNSVNAIQEEPRGSIDPARVLEKAYTSTKAKGSSTACIIALTDQGLHAINLGDSGFMVVRDGSTVFRSPVQQHDFNFTYQLESGNAGDLPSSGQVFTIPVAPGDIVIAGTDGLFDNMYNSDITALVVQAVRSGFGPQVTAQKIAALAQRRAQDTNRQTPFSTAAQEAGIRYYGGKLDDITVVVSYITSDENESLSANRSN